MQIKQIRFGIHDAIAREQIAIDVFEHLVKVFTPFVGKKISQRMITALNKDLPKGFKRADLSRIASLIQVVLIPEKSEDYDNKLTFLLGYSFKSNGTLFYIGDASSEHSGFAYYNNCHGGAARERNKIRRSLLSKSIKMAGYANTYATGIAIAAEAKGALIKLVGYQMETEMTKLLDMTVQN